MSTEEEGGSAQPDPQIDTERQFNNDLLLEPDDQAWARNRWGKVADYFIGDYLKKSFDHHEWWAKLHKWLVQLSGLAAVGLMLFSLLASAMQLWIPPGKTDPLIKVWTPAVESCAILGLVLAFFSARYGPFRSRWLRHRFLTECFRNGHFRTTVNSFHRIVPKSTGWTARDKEAIPPPDKEARQKEFQSLAGRLSGQVGDLMDQLRERGVHPLPTVELDQELEPTEEIRAAFAAYYELRLEHQLGYAIHKLSARDKSYFGVSGQLLTSALTIFSGFSLLFAVLLSVVQFGGNEDPRLTSMALVLVVTGVAARAFQDGLSIRQERESYQDYRNALESIQARWNSTEDPATLLALVRETEECAMAELARFLRNHDKAQFQ